MNKNIISMPKLIKKLILIVILGNLLGCKNNIANTVKIPDDKKPNFLFILTDDQTYASIHALNNDEIETPNMDKLSHEGITFTHCFNQGSWSGAVCLPSRTMLITGQTLFKASRNETYIPQWSRIEGNETKTEVPLWEQVFVENGYETFFTGKWHNTQHALLKSFDKAEAIGAGMFETRDKNGSSLPGYNRSPNSSPWKPWDVSYTGHWTPRVQDLLYDEEGNKKIGKPYVAEEHTSELYANKAIDYLTSNVKNLEKPFFMFVSFNAPHDPRQSPKEFVDKYPTSSIKIPENYLEEHPFDQGDHALRDEQLAPFPRTKEAVQLHRSEYYAIISHFDRELGRILSALETSGKSENTYVILTSDHGLAVGQHGLMGKQNQYDHSIRMPFIIKGPGLTQGKKINDMVYMQSIYATTCDLAEIETPETVDFKSLNGLLKGNAKGGEKYIFGAYKNLQRMIRSDKYKLIAYPHNKKIQLFDLINDPYETTNIIFDDKYKNIITNLFNQLQIKQKELGDNLVLQPEDYNF